MSHPDTVKERRFSFGVEGMTCASCVRIVETQIKKIPGVELASVNLATGRAYVVSSPEVTFDTLRHSVKKAGYTAVEEAPTEDVLEKRFRNARKNLIGAAAILLPLMVPMILHMAGMPIPWLTKLELAGGLLALVFPGRGILKGAAIALAHRHANMDTLVSLGAIASWVTTPLALSGLEVRSFGTLTAMLIAFHLSGRYIETRLKFRAARDMRALMAMQIKEVLVLEEGGPPTVLSVEAVKPGMVVLVRRGERIPLDGRVLKGRGAVDESMLKGEPVPRMAEESDPVVGGTVLQSGVLEVEVQQAAGDGYLARMIRLIEEAQSSRVPIQATADRVAAVFIPVVFLLALGASFIWYFFTPSLAPLLRWAGHLLPWVSPHPEPLSAAVFVFVATLVIACPCALGLATPLALVLGSSLAAKRGILIKSGEAIQKVGELDMLLLDKTGTLTEGSPRVVKYAGSPEALEAAARLEENSLHPLALAVRAYRDEKAAANSAPPEKGDRVALTDFQEIPGRGVKARIGGILWELGRPLDSAPYAAEMEGGATAVEIRRETKIEGSFIISDPLRPGAIAMVEELHRRGILPVMVTGDDEKTARTVARRVGIEEVHAGILPDEKLRLVQQHQKAGKIAAMAGDGINDAAALKASDVGFAMGTGADLSMESGDIILNNGDIFKILEAFDIAVLTFKTIKENLFWAFLYNAVAIPLALGGLLHPILAEIAMTFSSLNVIVNSLRIGKKHRPLAEDSTEPQKERTMEYNFSVAEMSCGHCKAQIEKTLTELGVKEIKVNLEAKTVKGVTEKDASELSAAMEAAGYPAVLIETGTGHL